jgi:hypothetical protein
MGLLCLVSHAGEILAIRQPDGTLHIRLPLVTPEAHKPDPMVFNYAESIEPMMDIRDDSLPSYDFTRPPGMLPTSPYPWKRNIVTTVFWVGELPTKNNPVPNTKSSWDKSWLANFGGVDSPSRRDGWIPVGFTPRQNPFYVALPYNDITKKGTKPEAKHVIPWFSRTFKRDGQSVCKGRWVAIRKGDRVCYAQWEDCGPFRTDHWEYVFGNERPKPNLNGGAGLDVSPAVRDYLGLSGRDVTDWRFVETWEVPPGPWRNWGTNNVFASNHARGDSF